MALIETINLCQKIGNKDILKNINLRIDAGEVLALIGPTGAGKTTLLRLIDLLDAPSSGKIIFAGSEVAPSRKTRLEAQRRMAFVFQKPVVFKATVYDNVACGLKWRNRDRNEIRQKVEEILKVVGLAAYQERNARTLSGGEVQRVAIARAVALEPELLLLDEPTANLDPGSTLKIEELIADVIRQHKTTVIMATHDMSQGQRLANKIAVLINGEIHQTGNSGEVFVSPTNREIAEFVGTENILSGVIAASEEGLVAINACGRTIEAISEYPVGEAVYACIRPENITLSPSTSPSSARNCYNGKITQVASLGPLRRLKVDCGFPLVALVTKRSAEELDLAEGRPVYATFKATAVHVIRREE